MWRLGLLLKKLWLLPEFFVYHFYDKLVYKWYGKKKLFPAWGIHLFTGRFGQGKSFFMVLKAYKLCLLYPQITILTNLNLTNFPEYTRIIKLKTANDILNAPDNTLVLIDEIGTLFNSRDFSSGKNSVPKPLFQHLCQCRHRHMMIYATVQRFNLLDKQIRDITATVTECEASFSHPFSRMFTGITYDIEEYEAWCINRMYIPQVLYTTVYIQKDKYRCLYDTEEMVSGLLKLEYLSDEEILRNQGSLPECYIEGTKEALKAYKKGTRRRR